MTGVQTCALPIWVPTFNGGNRSLDEAFEEAVDIRMEYGIFNGYRAIHPKVNQQILIFFVEGLAVFCGRVDRDRMAVAVGRRKPLLAFPPELYGRVGSVVHFHPGK